MDFKNISKRKEDGPKHLHLSLIIFFVCLLLTAVAWDHYFNSDSPLDRSFVSNLILAMGTLFSFSAAILVWSLESGKAYLEKEVKRRTEELLQKEREAAASEARSEEAERKKEEIKQAYQKLQQTQEELIQSEKLASVGRVVAGIVHELNNPLITIHGYIKYLLDNAYQNDEESRKSLEVICRQSEQCRKIVRDLLTFSRKERPHFQSVNPSHILDASLESLPREMTGGLVKIVKKYPAECPEIQADPDQLKRVFLNLLVNACHAVEETGNAGQITLSLLPVNEAVEFFITDTGSGIEKENLTHIFEPFFTTKPAGKGTGLGLSLSSAVIQMHGGKMAVESEAGRGTTFFIELPINPGRVKFQEAGAEERKKKILVADDDPLMMEFISKLIEAWGYKILPVESGEQAVSLAAKENGEIDLILLDLKRPGMNAFETAKRLKTNIRLSNTPILFLSGLENPRIPAQSGNGDTLIFLRKPFDYEVLHRHISERFAA